MNNASNKPAEKKFSPAELVNKANPPANKLTPEEIKAEKSARFKKVAGHRINAAIAVLNRLENCFNTANYYWTPEQAKIIMDSLETSVKKVQNKMNQVKESVTKVAL